MLFVKQIESYVVLHVMFRSLLTTIAMSGATAVLLTRTNTITPHHWQTDRASTATPTRSTCWRWPLSAPCRPRSGKATTSRQRSFPPRCSGRPRRSIRTICGRADVSVRRSRRQKAAPTTSAATDDVLNGACGMRRRRRRSEGGSEISFQVKSFMRPTQSKGLKEPTRLPNSVRVVFMVCQALPSSSRKRLYGVVCVVCMAKKKR